MSRAIAPEELERNLDDSAGEHEEHAMRHFPPLNLPIDGREGLEGRIRLRSQRHDAMGELIFRRPLHSQEPSDLPYRILRKYRVVQGMPPVLVSTRALNPSQSLLGRVIGCRPGESPGNLRLTLEGNMHRLGAGEHGQRSFTARTKHGHTNCDVTLP